MITPYDLYRMLARRFAQDGLKKVLPGGIWENPAPSGIVGFYATVRQESEDSETLSDGRMIMKGTMLVDVWTGGAGRLANPAVKALAASFKFGRLRLLVRRGRIMTWRPITWEGTLDAAPENGQDFNLTGLAWHFALETRR